MRTLYLHYFKAFGYWAGPWAMADKLQTYFKEGSSELVHSGPTWFGSKEEARKAVNAMGFNLSLELLVEF
jgi:hypothetical protein